MNVRFGFTAIWAFLGAAACGGATSSVPGPSSGSGAVTASSAATPGTKARARPFTPMKVEGNRFEQRFAELWNELHDPANGYFSPLGIPYHSVETLVVEAPDYGHESTSEAYSFWMWLEAMHGRLTHDWGPLADAWANAEAYIIPTEADQPTASSYDPSKPSTYTPELAKTAMYPAALDPSVKTGSDPLAGELAATYGTSAMYGMHWLLDVDDWYGFGRRGDGATAPSYFNTFQRGPDESVWETVPQPAWDALKWGGPHGYLDLFVAGSDAPQWKYTAAPDADARAIQAMYWASVWARESGASSAVAPLVAKAAKMGDYLRYSFFDKHFKAIGCTSPSCPAASDRRAAHYLLSWFYAWGGSLPSSGGWAWRIGASASHEGYQNPMAALALSRATDLRPRSPQATRDWATSFDRQLEMMRWLQSAEGGIAGGVTNSWEGHYGTPPAGTPTFYGMAYDPSPVYRDPPSNEWFGFQTWSVERIAEVYYVTGDPRAKAILDRWVAWATKNTKLTDDGSYQVPSSLAWSGQPARAYGAGAGRVDLLDPAHNPTLHVKVTSTSNDVGSAAGLAQVLAFYSARSGDLEARKLARELLDRMWTKYRDAKGVSTPETRTDYKRFADPVTVPAGWKGKMPNGDVIDGQSTFIGIRSKMKSDPDWPKVEAYLRGGPAPVLTIHRFWAQAEIALANATYGWLFGGRSEPKPVATRK